MSTMSEDARDVPMTNYVTRMALAITRHYERGERPMLIGSRNKFVENKGTVIRRIIKAAGWTRRAPGERTTRAR